MKPERQPP